MWSAGTEVVSYSGSKQTVPLQCVWQKFCKVENEGVHWTLMAGYLCAIIPIQASSLEDD